MRRAWASCRRNKPTAVAAAAAAAAAGKMDRSRRTAARLPAGTSGIVVGRTSSMDGSSCSWTPWTEDKPPPVGRMSCCRRPGCRYK